MHLDSEARTFAVGGEDRTVKVWMYDEGVPIACGKGHSGTITKVRYSPDNSFVVSVGEEGGIFIWSAPRIPAAFGGAGREEDVGVGAGAEYADPGVEGKEEMGYYGEEEAGGMAAAGGGGY